MRWWQTSRRFFTDCLAWEFACRVTLAPSHLDMAVSGPGVVASQAENRMSSKYWVLSATYCLISVAVEIMRALWWRTLFINSVDELRRWQASDVLHSSYCSVSVLLFNVVTRLLWLGLLNRLLANWTLSSTCSCSVSFVIDCGINLDWYTNLQNYNTLSLI